MSGWNFKNSASIHTKCILVPYKVPGQIRNNVQEIEGLQLLNSHEVIGLLKVCHCLVVWEGRNSSIVAIAPFGAEADSPERPLQYVHSLTRASTCARKTGLDEWHPGWKAIRMWANVTRCSWKVMQKMPQYLQFLTGLANNNNISNEKYCFSLNIYSLSEWVLFLRIEVTIILFKFHFDGWIKWKAVTFQIELILSPNLLPISIAGPFIRENFSKI